MIRWVQTRLVIEKPVTHEKYYPKVLSASTQSSYPFSISNAAIELVSNARGSTSSYVSQVRFDDIVRLQVSIKYNPNQRTVWQDIFQGRIVDINAEFGTNNNVQLYCLGHEADAETALIEETKAYTSATDARDLLSYFSKYLSRLEYSASYADAGVSLPTYDTTAHQTYVADLFSDMEKVSGFDWAIKTVPTYSNGNLDKVYLQWKPFPTVPVQQYKVIEGTSRLLNADFSSSGKKVRTAFRMFGESPSGGTQYTGYAEDAALVARYGKRTATETQTWIKSNSLCASIASGVLSGLKTPEVSGQVVLLGTPDAQTCDLVYCKIPSEDLNGEQVNRNFHVYRVQHNITENDFYTTLDVGELRNDFYDYIGQVAKTANICRKNQVK